MQKYRCHKIVEAQDLAAKGVELVLGDAFIRVRLNGELLGNIPTRIVPPREIAEIEDGYIVKYEDGYTSWSPREAFEDGYAAIPPDAR